MIAKQERRQFLATAILCLISLSFGGSCGWISPAMLLLQSPTDPLLATGPITAVDASWIAGTISLGGILGTLVFGYLVDRIGRKRCLLLNAVAPFIGWTLILTADTVFELCVSRFASGFGAGGTFIVVPIFISEIADDRIRGRLGSAIVFSCNLGILLMFALGYFFSYTLYSSALIVLPVINFLGVLYLPETPKRLIAEHRLEEAERSLQFYHNSKHAQLELLEKPLPSGADSLHVGEVVGWQWADLTTRGAKKAFFIGFVMMCFNQFCGLFAMITYTATIFQDAGSSLSPNLSAIIVAVIQLIGSYLSTVCVDRFGRKILLAGSGFGIALGLSMLGLFMFLKKELGYDMQSMSWIPLFCFCFPIFIGNMGIMALPFLIVSEIFPQKIKSFAVTVCMIALHGLSFIAIKYFAVISDQIGLHYCFFFFSVCSTLGAIFTIVYMPETKGRSFEEIEKLLSK